MSKVETEVQIENAVSSAGTVTIKDGELKGTRNRTVTLQATPATGYSFEGWEVEKTQTKLRVFITPVDGLYLTANLACNSTSGLLNNLEQVTARSKDVKTLYTDGRMLYTDVEGNFPAATGYWAINGRTSYINYDGLVLPVIETCPTSPTTAQQTVYTGGGGSGGGTNPLVRDREDEFSIRRGVTGVSDNDPNKFNQRAFLPEQME